MQTSQPKETLSFKIELSGTFWDKLPEYSVLVNDNLIERKQIQDSSIHYVEFTVELEENLNHKLQIRLENKEDSDTIQNADKTAIEKDMLLNIDNIEIDDLPLGQLMWDRSEFIPDSSSRPVLKHCVNLGWNGAYTLEFSSPFYLWLLENI